MNILKRMYLFIYRDLIDCLQIDVMIFVVPKPRDLLPHRLTQTAVDALP